MRSLFRCLSAAALLAAAGPAAFAQWAQQTIPLRAGWNAVFLTVDPYPKSCGELFENLPVGSVWQFDQRFSPVQFIEDPAELTPSNPTWRSYFPPSSPQAFATNLYALDAGKAYLIEAREAFEWTVSGAPELTVQAWNPDSYNLAGFHVDAQNPPTFAEWFAPSGAHNPLEVWSLDTAQNWVRVDDPANTPIESGRAYWVMCNGASEYQGPVEIRFAGGSILDYSRLTAELDVDFRRPGGGAGEVTVQSLPSAQPPAPVPGEDRDVYALAGPVPMTYYGTQVQGNQEQITYLPLPAPLPFAAGETAYKPLSLAVDRTQMPPYNGPGEARYQSLLAVGDGNGYRRVLGVVSDGPFAGGAARRRVGTAQADENPFAGLWVGDVVLDQVQEPNLEIATNTPAAFAFRIILHNDAQGRVRLLNEVTQLWRDGTYKPDPLPDDPNARSVDQPGRIILMTPTAPESLLNELRIGESVRPATLRDGRPFANRVSTAMFTLLDENRMPADPLMDADGAFGADGGRLSLLLTMEDNDPMNPFHHQFHPMHAYPPEGEAPAPGNSWTVTREISLEFLSDPPANGAPAGWGDTELGGMYREVLTGLKKDPILVEGVFRIGRVADTPVLNDGLNS